MSEMIDFLKQFNIQNLIGMAAICWYFTRDLKAQMEKIDKDLRDKINQESKKIDQQSNRTDELYKMFIDLLKSKR